MKEIFTLAQKSFRKNVRNKLFIVFLLFAIGLIFLSILLDFLTFTAGLKIIKDVGLAGIYVFCALIAVFLSGEAIVGEVEKKNVYILLSKPLTRGDFIMGSFLGVVWTAIVAIISSGGVFLFLLYIKQGFVEAEIFATLLFIGLEVVVVSSIGILFSSFCSSAMTSSFLCFFIYLLGHLVPQLRFVAEKMERGVIKGIIVFAVWVLPNLEYFNLRGTLAKGGSLSFAFAGKVAVYAIFYSTVCLIIAYLIFQRREL